MEAWTTCPECNMSGYHLIGEKIEVHTGKHVLSLEVIEPIEVGFFKETDPPQYTTVKTALFDREKIRIDYLRTCLNVDCPGKWFEPHNERIG